MTRAVQRQAAIRHRAAIRNGGAIVLAGVWLAMWRLGTDAFDARVYELLYAGHRPLLAATAHAVTLLGEPTLLIAAGFACAWWLWRRGRGRTALALLAVVLIGRGLAEVQKYEIARLRPALEPHLVLVRTSSFPSGHATSSMIFYLTAALMLAGGTRWLRPAVAVAIAISILVGISRVMLGVHWPSDVIGGWAFGLLWVLVVLPLAERFERRYP